MLPIEISQAFERLRNTVRARKASHEDHRASEADLAMIEKCLWQFLNQQKPAEPAKLQEVENG